MELGGEAEYRVKEEPKYRPYQNKDEHLNNLEARHYNYHNIWLKSKVDDNLSMITEYKVTRIMFGSKYLTYSHVYETYTF